MDIPQEKELTISMAQKEKKVILVRRVHKECLAKKATRAIPAHKVTEEHLARKEIRATPLLIRILLLLN
jgi:hypothetical protein